MRELAVISAEGGTGKTTLVASFAALAGHAVLADCDLGATGRHLVLRPTILKHEDFRCGPEAIIRQADCIGCGACLAQCRVGAVLRIDCTDDMFAGANPCKNCDDGCVRSCPVKFADMLQAIEETCGRQDEHIFAIDSAACDACGACVLACPVKAIDLAEEIAGEWYVSDTSHGPMVHARLRPGGERSGRLVTKLREAARALAEERKTTLVLVDGPAGIGSAMIASIHGASQVLIVTEPTLSGAHDMGLVLKLTRHFGVPAAVCVNKWDLNEDMATRIESEAHQAGAAIAGRIRYDGAVTGAQSQGKTVVEPPATPAGQDIQESWARIRRKNGAAE